MTQYLTMCLNLSTVTMGFFPLLSRIRDMILMLVLLIFHQVTIDVASPEAGVIQKVIY
jgi:hypothetical protein